MIIIFNSHRLNISSNSLALNLVASKRARNGNGENAFDGPGNTTDNVPSSPHNDWVHETRIDSNP